MTARICLAIALAFVGAAEAHDGVRHATVAEAKAHATPDLAFPIAVGGPFVLTDQHGRQRSEADPAGHLQLLFFGYANCQEICSAALPQMADVAAALRARDVVVTPVMITVDPERDKIADLGPALAKFGPDFIGLTGDAKALAKAYAAFSIEVEQVTQTPDGAPVFAHGSYLYLLDGQGQVLTLFPPILPLEQVIDLVATYAAKR